MKLIESYESCGKDLQVWKCECGRTYIIPSGCDVPDCVCTEVTCSQDE